MLRGRGQTPANTKPRWSDELGRLLLAPIPDAELARHWDLPPRESGGTADVRSRLRRELLEWARQDEDVQQWIMQTWRAMHDNIVNALEFQPIEVVSGRCDELLAAFELVDIALGLITEDHEDGWELAEGFAGQIRCETTRQEYERVLRRIAGESPAAVEHVARVVVFGGHPRDESRLGDRFAESGRFDIRWKTFERKNNGSATAREVTASLRDAEAAIIVLGMASHALARTVKSYAEACGIPYRCVDKATEKQLTETLRELFPEG